MKTPLSNFSPDPEHEDTEMLSELERTTWIDAYLDELTSSHINSAPSISDLVLQSRAER